MSGAVPIGEDDLQAWVDGRLSPDRQAAVDAALAGDPVLAARLAAERLDRDRLRSALASSLATPIPARLRIANIRAAQRSRQAGRLKVAAAILVVFMAGGGSGWLAGRWSGPRDAPSAPTTAVARAANAAYRTFVVEVAHPVEVKAGQQAHLLQWLSRRLGRPLPAPDLARYGYRLMGGRVLPAASGAAAQLMYEDAAGKRLTLYVQASNGDETAFRFRQDGEAATFAWIDRGFGYAITAPGARETLLPIAEAVYHDFGDATETPRAP